MGLILNLETATSVCSVALAKDGHVIAFEEDHSEQSHARLVQQLIDNCLKSTNLSVNQLEAVAVSMGPGSFTGLRIGVASAKGLCYALDIPLLAVNTLQAMAENYLLKTGVQNDCFLCPMIDARRMEVYSAFFDNDAQFTGEVSAVILEDGIFDHQLNQKPVFFFGDGMEKSRKVLENHPNAKFNSKNFSSALGMVRFSENSYKTGRFESLAYFEPFYLKDFFTSRQPNKG
jgi:tRNA threonylcarbamoyladenosine biosynthesis protein TsaB